MHEVLGSIPRTAKNKINRKKESNVQGVCSQLRRTEPPCGSTVLTKLLYSFISVKILLSIVPTVYQLPQQKGLGGGSSARALA